MEEKIKERASVYFPSIESKRGVRVVLNRLPNGHDSEIYDVALTNGNQNGKHLILKLHRPAWAPAEERLQQAGQYAQQEYEALSFLWHEFARRSHRFAVPKPLDYFPEDAAVVIEKCEGEPLDQALRWARFFKLNAQRDRLYQQAGACGAWLELFHRITGRAGDPSEIYERIEWDFCEDLRTCLDLGLDPGLASQMATWFERRRDIAFTGDHQIVSSHCDFSPYNVLVSEDRITVIDLEGLQDGIVYDDLCYFVGMIESLPAYHLSRKMSLRIRESFLQGYSWHGNLDQDQFDVFMLLAMVKIMARSPVLKGGPGRLDQWKRQQRLKVYTSWFEQSLR
jgi:Ser/Thr protein kinase RdoA (MazF antagonist)